VFCVFPLWCLVVSTSAVDCLERLISEMTYYVSSGTLDPTHSHYVSTVQNTHAADRRNTAIRCQVVKFCQTAVSCMASVCVGRYCLRVLVAARVSRWSWRMSSSISVCVCRGSTTIVRSRSFHQTASSSWCHTDWILTSNRSSGSSPL